MHTRVLFNSNAGSAADCDVDALRTLPGVELVDCQSAEATLEAAAAAGPDGIDLVVAAGGDGTVHLVANGLMRAGATAADRPALGVLPVGTGNDLARTLALDLGLDPIPAVEALQRAERRALDLIRVSHDGDDGETGYAINVCAGGFSGAVDEAMTPEMKATWGPFAYLLGAARALSDLEPFALRIAWEGGPEESILAYNVVVANARTAGGGKPVAPRADPEDGALDVVVVTAQANLALLAARLLTVDYLDDDGIVFQRVERLRVRATPGMWFNVDGELRTDEPVSFAVVPGALRVCVGAGYQAAPA